MLVLVPGVMFELWLAARLAALAAHRPHIAEIGRSLWRSAVVMAAVLLAYPALFGFRAAPALIILLPGNVLQGVGALTLVFLCRVLASLVPALRVRTGMLDTLQGMAAVAVLFAWYSHYLGALSTSVWPGLLAALALWGLSVLMPALAAGLGRDFGAGLAARFGIASLEPLCGQAMGMAAVAPIVMLYGYLLGMQLAM